MSASTCIIRWSLGLSHCNSLQSNVYETSNEVEIFLTFELNITMHVKDVHSMRATKNLGLPFHASM